MKFSIIIPTLNRAWCIKNAINSVLNQNYPDYEIIIIDDGSTDNTREVVQEFLGENIRYFWQKNQGKGNAVNFALNKISGDIMFILDSDDELIKWVFEETAKEFNQDKELVSVHFLSKFPPHIHRKSQLIWWDRLYLKYSDFLVAKKFRWDMHGFINVKKLWNTRFESKCPNWLESIFYLRLLKKWWESLFVNKEFLFMDASRQDAKDNLTSFASTFFRAPSMIAWYEILIKENFDEALKIDKNTLWKWYFQKFQWQIICKEKIKGFDSFFKSIKYTKSLTSKLKKSLFITLFLIPNFMLKYVLQIYYKNK